MSVYREKRFPDHYSEEIADVIRLFSFKQAVLVGSSSLRSQLNAGDYDMGEEVKVPSVSAFVKGFQEIVKNIYHTKGLYLGDIKCGRIVEWSVIDPDAQVVDGKIKGYTPTQSKAKLRKLYEDKIITKAEYDDADGLLGSSVESFLTAKKEIKFDVVRWKYADVVAGFTVLRDGRQFSLEDAIQTPGLCKVDAVGWVQNSRYSEFSCLYEVSVKGKVLNKVNEVLETSLQNDMLYYKLTGNSFKYAKRLFAYAKYKKDEKLGDELTSLFNGELGRLYLMRSDMATLLWLMENENKLDAERIRYEIDGFRARLGTIYDVKALNDHEHTLLGTLRTMTKLPVKGDKIEKDLERVMEMIDEALNTSTTKWLKEKGLWDGKVKGAGTHRENVLKRWKQEDKGYSLEELAEMSGVPLKTLQEVYNRGIGAYKTNPESVRLKGSYVKGVKAPMSKKLSKEQWAMARVYSFLDGNKKHDNDLRGGGVKTKERIIESLPIERKRTKIPPSVVEKALADVRKLEKIPYKKMSAEKASELRWGENPVKDEPSVAIDLPIIEVDKLRERNVRTKAIFQTPASMKREGFRLIDKGCIVVHKGEIITIYITGKDDRAVREGAKHLVALGEQMKEYYPRKNPTFYTKQSFLSKDKAEQKRLLDVNREATATDRYTGWNALDGMIRYFSAKHRDTVQTYHPRDVKATKDNDFLYNLVYSYNAIYALEKRYAPAVAKYRLMKAEKVGKVEALPGDPIKALPATSLGASENFASALHDDSGIRGITESILWSKTKGGKKSYFVNDEAKLAFDLSKDNAMVLIPPKVSHGTADTGEHGGFGYVIITKANQVFDTPTTKEWNEAWKKYLSTKSASEFKSELAVA